MYTFINGWEEPYTFSSDSCRTSPIQIPLTFLISISLSRGRQGFQLLNRVCRLPRFHQLQLKANEALNDLAADMIGRDRLS